MSTVKGDEREAYAKWQQGSPLPHEFKKELFGELASTNTFAILVSQDCDILSDKEPKAEAILLEASKGEDDNKRKGGNPRSLQLKSEYAGKEIWLDAAPWNRKFFDRETLKDMEPLEDFSLDNRKLLADWLSKRYFRFGRPGAFDRRFNGVKGREKLKKALKSRHKAIRDLFIRIDPERELAEGDEYNVLAAIVLEPELEEDLPSVAAANYVGDKIEEIFEKCDGIAGETMVVKASEFRYSDFLAMRKWDYDYMSY